MEKLLIIEDSEEIKTQLKWGLKKEYILTFASNAREGISLFKKHNPKVVTLDLGLPPSEDTAEEGLQCLSEIIRINPFTKVIVITGNNDHENALKAIEKGAYDYYRKPINLNELKIILKRAFHLANLEKENRKLKERVEKKETNLCGMVGQCYEMKLVFDTIRRVATSDVPVFIQGESGTGKELAARAIHSLSMRSEGPFVPINCGAIPENLLESELFGYEKGAFTGAENTTAGKFEYADRGTLFLDEIGDLPLKLQVKLLRFLQDKKIQRIGGRKDIFVDTRVITATNVDIQKSIEEGRFREDLFYRIGVVTIKLPPLRERGEDILLLANLFLSRFSRELGKNIKGFSLEAQHAMKEYDWPGNVRELENRIQRAILLTNKSVLDATDLGLQSDDSKAISSQNYSGLTLKEVRELIEKDVILACLDRHQWNILNAAKELGISRPTLYELLRKYHIRV
ncbi:MAG: PEP-CTERM-box response regulator transcription factor [Nitrospirae bacterium]|nr:MAG: PEP-CTERM-box response regulator transcription factor [Nitrospirota bacterium]